MRNLGFEERQEPVALRPFGSTPSTPAPVAPPVATPARNVAVLGPTLRFKGELRATRNWRRIAMEQWPFVNGPPSTPLGQEEADWLAGEAAETAAASGNQT